MNLSIRIALVATLSLGLLVLDRAHAQIQFPAKSIRVILPVTTGGSADIAARHIGQHLQKIWGQSLIVEALPGAGGTLAARLVARAEPDGYTLLLAVNSFGVSPAMMKDIGYDPLADFVPVAWLFEAPVVMIGSLSLQARNVTELVALAKAKPGTINVAISGNGTLVHLASEAFRRTAAIDVVHVPYRGQAPAITDLLGAKVDVMFAEPSAMRYASEGKVVALGTSGARRMPQFPTVPTIAESGYPGFITGAWFGVLAPTKTPKAIVEKLSAGINESLQSSAVTDFADKFGFQIVGGNPQRLGQHIRNELVTNAKLVSEAGIRAE